MVHGWGWKGWKREGGQSWRELNSDRLLPLDSPALGGGVGLKIWRSQRCVWG